MMPVAGVTSKGNASYASVTVMSNHPKCMVATRSNEFAKVQQYSQKHR